MLCWCSGAHSTLFCFANKGATLKVHILEVVKGTASAPAFQKRAVDIQVSQPIPLSPLPPDYVLRVGLARCNRGRIDARDA